MSPSKPRKPASPSVTHVAGPETRGASALDGMAPSELAGVLRTLLDRHPELCSEAEAVALEMISSPSIDEAAEDVFDAVASLGLDSLNARAGRKPWGYVEPTEAAWELLDEAVAPAINDMKRCLALGLQEAAEAICGGIVLGLHRAKNIGSDGALAWAPDFPAEQACHAVAELIRTTARDAVAARERLVETVGKLVPDWKEMIARSSARALSNP